MSIRELLRTMKELTFFAIKSSHFESSKSIESRWAAAAAAAASQFSFKFDEPFSGTKLLLLSNHSWLRFKGKNDKLFENKVKRGG